MKAPFIGSPKVTHPTKLKVLPHTTCYFGSDKNDISLIDELYYLKAIKVITSQQYNLRVIYGTNREEVVALLSNCPFLTVVDYSQLPEETFWLYSMDRNLAEQTEYTLFQNYNSSRIRAANKDFIRTSFVASWHKSNYAIWSIASVVKCTFEMPKDIEAPYLPFNKTYSRQVKNSLTKSKLCKRNYILHDLNDPEMHMLDDICNAISCGSMKDFEIISLYTLLNKFGPEEKLKVMSCLNPDLAICASTVNASILWAAGVERILLLYTGSTPTWDQIKPKRPFIMGMSMVPVEHYAAAIFEASQILLQDID